MSLAFRKELISQIPALRLLIAPGYSYLTPEEALRAELVTEMRALFVMTGALLQNPVE